MKLQGWHVLPHIKKTLVLWIQFYRTPPLTEDVADFAFLNSHGGRIYVSDIQKNLSAAVARFGPPGLHESVTFSSNDLRSLNDTVVASQFGAGTLLQQFRRSYMHSSAVAERHYNRESATTISQTGFAILASAASSSVSSPPPVSTTSSSSTSAGGSDILPYATAVQQLSVLFPSSLSHVLPPPCAHNTLPTDSSSDDETPLIVSARKRRQQLVTPHCPALSKRSRSSTPLWDNAYEEEASSVSSKSPMLSSTSELDNIMNIIERLRDSDDEDEP